MRLLDDSANVPLDKIWAYLTEREAAELLESLTDYFSETPPLPEWHTHVESDDGRAKELTIAIYEPSASTKDPRWETWFKEDRWEPGMFGAPAD
jgi:hypothetical protein